MPRASSPTLRATAPCAPPRNTVLKSSCASSVRKGRSAPGVGDAFARAKAERAASQRAGRRWGRVRRCVVKARHRCKVSVVFSIGCSAPLDGFGDKLPVRDRGQHIHRQAGVPPPAALRGVSSSRGRSYTRCITTTTWIGLTVTRNTCRARTDGGREEVAKKSRRSRRSRDAVVTPTREVATQVATLVWCTPGAG